MDRSFIKEKCFECKHHYWSASTSWAYALGMPDLLCLHKKVGVKSLYYDDLEKCPKRKYVRKTKNKECV